MARGLVNHTLCAVRGGEVEVKQPGSFSGDAAEMGVGLGRGVEVVGGNLDSQRHVVAITISLNIAQEQHVAQNCTIWGVPARAQEGVGIARVALTAGGLGIWNTRPPSLHSRHQKILCARMSPRSTY